MKKAASVVLIAKFTCQVVWSRRIEKDLSSPPEKTAARTVCKARSYSLCLASTGLEVN